MNSSTWVGRVANEEWLVSSSMISRAWMRSAIFRLSCPRRTLIANGVTPPLRGLLAGCAEPSCRGVRKPPAHRPNREMAEGTRPRRRDTQAQRSCRIFRSTVAVSKTGGLMGDSVVGAHTDLPSDQGARQGDHPGRSRDPNIKVHDIAWSVFEKPDLVRAEAFSLAFGFSTTVGLDEWRYRLHLKAVHAVIKGIPTHLQYFPLTRDQRAHYHRTGTVAPIPLPTRNPHQSNRWSTPSARSRGNGSRNLSNTDLSGIERANLMAKLPSGHRVSVR